MVDNTITHQKQNKDLDMTGKPVLVQNELGIFYGMLEKADTRSGTALLTNGLMLSPERHITFQQYLNFVQGEVEELLMYIESGDYVTEDSDDQQDPLYYAEKKFPNEISISNAEFLEHKRNISITDYATEGVALVQFRTSTYWNTNIMQATSSTISLTGVIAIVAIDPDSQIANMDLLKLSAKDSSGLGIIESVLGWDIPVFRVVNTFEKLIERFKYEDDTEYFFNLPKLVVNTDQRVSHFQAITKAYDNEQNS